MNILRTGRRGRPAERRRGKDRRKRIDPRYRNPAYLEFVDTRKGERRKPLYGHQSRPIREPPERRRAIVIGIVAVFFLFYLFFLWNLEVHKRLGEGTRRKCSIRIGCLDLPE